MRKSSLLVGLIVALSCWAVPSLAGVLEIPLIDKFDQFGGQIETVQYYYDGTTSYSAFGIYDTGASVVTYSFSDRQLNELLGSPIGIKVVNGAQADGIGGSLTGDISKPGAVMAYGLGALGNILDPLTGTAPSFDANVAVPGVQMFVGASPGSESLPTITGTPIHYPTTAQPGGRAAKINMTGYEFNLGELFPGDPLFAGMAFQLPDVSFVASGSTTLSPRTATTDAPATTAVVQVPLALFGEDNHANPGDSITAAPNPVVSGAVTLKNQPGDQLLTIGGKTFLFDTGAQLSVISSEIAEALGLDLDNPEWTVDVQGAAGTNVPVPGFVIDALELPVKDSGDGVDTLRFTNVPVHVLDMGFGIDGILGMNLFNTAADMLYDPYAAGGPWLQLSFFDPNSLIRDDPTTSESSALAALLAAYPSFAGMLGQWPNSLTYYQFEAVPEPSTLLLLAVGTVGLLIVRRRR